MAVGSLSRTLLALFRMSHPLCVVRHLVAPLGHTERVRVAVCWVDLDVSHIQVM